MNIPPPLTPEEEERGVQFAAEMDTVIEMIVTAVSETPELRERDLKMMISCFLSMATQWAQSMGMPQEYWETLCKTMYEQYSKAKEEQQTH